MAVFTGSRRSASPPQLRWLSRPDGAHLAARTVEEWCEHVAAGHGARETLDGVDRGVTAARNPARALSGTLKHSAFFDTVLS